MNRIRKTGVRVLALTIMLVAGAAGATGIVNADGTSNGVVLNTSGGAPAITINQSGSYKLTSNYQMYVGLHNPTVVVSITANDVTLDLGGFVLGGGNVCTPKTDGHGGVNCSYPSLVFGALAVSGRSVTVMNGTISGAYGIGISINPGAYGVQLRDLVVEGNLGMGVLGGVDNIHAINVRANNNGSYGFSMSGATFLEGVHADGNGADGINIAGGTLYNVSAYNNRGNGIVDNGALIVGAQAYNNYVDGIQVLGGSIENARAIGNNNNGVYAYDSIVENTTSFGNVGIQFNLQGSCYSHLNTSTGGVVGGAPLGAGAICYQ